MTGREGGGACIAHTFDGFGCDDHEVLKLFRGDAGVHGYRDGHASFALIHIPGVGIAGIHIGELPGQLLESQLTLLFCERDYLPASFEIVEMLGGLQPRLVIILDQPRLDLPVGFHQQRERGILISQLGGRIAKLRCFLWVGSVFGDGIGTERRNRQ